MKASILCTLFMAIFISPLTLSSDLKSKAKSVEIFTGETLEAKEKDSNIFFEFNGASNRSKSNSNLYREHNINNRLENQFDRAEQSNLNITFTILFN
ncbi:hypothetical protein [Spartinivicinus poritis]|uniref:Uncharacterized protein n=1 Tax=Spartinivicinus poritis TaxID=2994640 RepID=A0ABT5UHH7_9GAMM|nr:hypothetical protein [Spartinivicinus sp. A2-2]MDE1465767.1 hypothetical protein [Spartinivicinus sp. A2-2]